MQRVLECLQDEAGVSDVEISAGTLCFVLHCGGASACCTACMRRTEDCVPLRLAGGRTGA